MEEDLIQWIQDQRDQRLRVTRKGIQLKALELHESSDEDTKTFVANLGWLQKFFARHSIILRHRTTVSQKLPAAVVPKLESFFCYVHSLMIKKAFQDSQVGAMDETPVWLNMTADTTVDFVGTRSIPLKSTGHEKVRVTVVLGAKANGSKLPPFIVFKGKRKEKELDKITGMVCAMSDNGWMNEEYCGSHPLLAEEHLGASFFQSPPASLGRL